MLAAILAGNAAYFALLPHLPSPIRHEPFALDPGLAIDFLICAGAYAAMSLVLRRRAPRSTGQRPRDP